MESKLYDETEESMFGPAQEPTEYLSISVIHAMDSVLKGPARIGRVPTISRHDSYGDSPAVIHRMLLIRVSANVSITRNHEDRENNGAQTLDSRHACRTVAWTRTVKNSFENCAIFLSIYSISFSFFFFTYLSICNNICLIL